MKFKALLAALSYGYLLFIRPQTTWGRTPVTLSDNNHLATVDIMGAQSLAVEPAFTVFDFIARVENYKCKIHIHEQMIEDLETYFQNDYYLDENMLEKIISLLEHAPDNEDISIMYYIHLKTYIELCKNKSFGLPLLKKTILAQYKAIEKSIILTASREGPNPIELKFQKSWGEFKANNAPPLAPPFDKEIDDDTLSELLTDARASIFQEKYQIVIQALEHISNDQIDGVSSKTKELMEDALAQIKLETHYSTAHIKIPAVLDDNKKNVLPHKLKSLIQRIKSYQNNSKTSKEIQKLIFEHLNTDHEHMLFELEQLLNFAERSNDPFLLNEVRIAYFMGYRAVMEFNVHVMSNLTPFKKSIIEKLSEIRGSLDALDMRTLDSIKIPGTYAIQPLEKFNVKSEDELQPEKLVKLIDKVTRSPFTEHYHSLKNILISIKKHHNIKQLPPETIILMNHMAFMIKNEFNQDITIDRELSEAEFERGMQHCKLPTETILNAVHAQVPASQKALYSNYMAKKVIDVFFEHYPYDTLDGLFQAIDMHFNSPGRVISADPIVSIFALALREINNTTPFTSKNFTAIAWKTINDFEHSTEKKPLHHEIYLRAKRIIIEKFSQQPSSYYIPISIVILMMLIFAIKRLSAKNIKNIDQEILKIEETQLPAQIATPITHAYQSNLPLDPFPDVWGKFKQFVKSELALIHNKIGDLLTKHQLHVVQKIKLTWLNQSNEERLLYFLNCNIDWLAQLDKSVLAEVIDFHHWDALRITINKKSLELEKQQQLDHLKKILAIPAPKTKYDSKVFSKAIKYINNLIPNNFTDVPLPSNAELIHTIAMQLKFQSGLSDFEVEYILDELDKMHKLLKTNTYIAPKVLPTEDNSNPDAMVPDFLYELWAPQSDNPMSTISGTSKLSVPKEKGKQAVNNKIEITLNPPYCAFALNLGKHLNLAFNPHTALTNRAYKLLIIQFHSLILSDKSIGYNELLNDIRNRFCHKWQLIANSQELQVILHHILCLIEQTRHGSLDTISDLDNELKLYPKKILALEKSADPIYRGKANAAEKIIALLQEFDETATLYTDKEFGDLAKLAIIDILCEIAETLTYSNISHVNPLWAQVRATGYHHSTPSQTLIDQAITQGIPDLRKMFPYPVINKLLLK